MVYVQPNMDVHINGAEVIYKGMWLLNAHSHYAITIWSDKYSVKDMSLIERLGHA